MSEVKPWYRLPEESSRAYSAFKTFLDAPNRSLQNVAEMIQKSRPTINRWANKYEWRERAAAYDSSIVEHERKTKIKLREGEIAKLRQMSNLLADKVIERMSTLKTEKMSPRTTVDMALAAKDLMKEVHDRETALETECRVESITIRKYEGSN